MLTEAVQGERRIAINAQGELRLGPLSDLIVNDAGLGRYFEAARTGRLFAASTQAGVALSLLSATATGLILSNPAGSGKAMVVLDIEAENTVAIAAVGAVGIAANVNPAAAAVVHTTPLTVRNLLLSGSAGVGLADSAATLPAAPVFIRGLWGVTSATPSATIVGKEDIGGAIIITPGCAISLQAVTTAYTVLASATWAEIDWPL